ncbi:Lon protease [uncultured archaeon]|nr:Lon protease [uncultured archaeon]
MRKILAFFILLSFAAFAQCNGSASHYLPAVVEGDGVLVNVTLTLENGSGDVFMSIYPKMGISTQDSAKTAVEYAYKATNSSGCDAKIKAYLPSSVGGYLDGPSGGAAITLMAIAALEGKHMRDDAMITDTTSRDGTVGPVGGLYEKAKIAKENGLKYFITPPEGLFERVMLRMLRERGAFSILETGSIGDAQGFMMDGKNLSYGKRPPAVEAINESIPAYNGRKDFSRLADGMMALKEASISKIDPGLAAEENLSGYFSQVERNEHILASRGYYFSAANDAFLNYLDAETIANGDTLDVEGKVAQVNGCLANVQGAQITDANFEWVAGSELRESWAVKKLGEVRDEAGNATLREEKYVAYHDAMYADAWCRISGLLEANAPSGGNPADESSLENLSAQYLAAATKANVSDSDALWHLENAQALHSQGKYAGAIYDSVFAIEMDGAGKSFDANEDAALGELSRLSAEKRQSFWGDVYASHAAFVMDGGDNATAYSLYRFARGLDQASVRMRTQLQAGRGGLDAQTLIYAEAIAISALAAAIIYFYLYGRGTTKQKTNLFKRKKGK